MPVIRLETSLPAPPERCFDLSLSVDAHLGSMVGSGERAIAGVTSGIMGPGDTVTWRARHLGHTFTMTSVISEYAAPSRFVDEQVSGPFRAWRHEHRFSPDGRGGTLMVDVATYRSPAGAIGRVVDRLVLTRYLTRLLGERNEYLRQQVTGG